MSKRNRRLCLLAFLGVLAVLGSVIFTGCQKVDSGEGQKDQVEASENTEKESINDQIKTLEGNVADGTMATLAIEDKDGKVYSFGTEGVDIETGESGIVIGNLVSLKYKGDLDPNAKAQDVEILSIKIEDSKDQGQKVLKGTVAEGTMNTLTVEDEEGNHYFFDRQGVDVKTGPNGIVIGNPVTITYKGDLDPKSPSQKVQVLSIVVEDAEGLTENKAKTILKDMTLEEKVGQMFIGRVPDADGAKMVEDYKLGGYILFGKDFKDKTKDQVTTDIGSYQVASKIPMFIGVDEEGGTVNRVSTNPNLSPQAFKAPRDLIAEGGLDLLKADAEEKSKLLKSLGININFGPVADLSDNPKDFIYKRSFGGDPDQVGEYIREVVTVMSKANMASVLKHFPGYGDNLDTHGQVAYDKRPVETFENEDFIPFKAGIEAGASGVLVSHNVVEAIDEENPASLSPEVHKILREDLGFKDLIITDDLAMEGVKAFGTDEDLAVRAVLAGNDLLCTTNFQTQIPAVIQAVKDGRISEDLIDTAVERILETKISFGLL